MNILLTTRCNKNCSFCFARQAAAAKIEDMSLENFQKLILLAKAENYAGVKLLGGEPTIHPDFSAMLTFLSKERFPATLISNLLYTDPAVRECINQAAAKGIIHGVLANAAELNTPETLGIFKQNYSALLEATAKEPGKITAGITLSRQKSAAEETEYIAFLAQNIYISRLRLSLDFQAENVEDKFFINNKEYGQKILAVVHKCLDLRIPISWDCKLYPCMFEEAVFQKDIAGFAQSLRLDCQAGGAPFDVFPDMSYIHCYPARVLSGQNILKFSRISEALNEIAFRKKALQALQKNNPPGECKECNYYRTGRCDSLCLGCRELTASFLTQE